MRAHPAEGTLQAYLDGELASPRGVLIELHLFRCASCRARVDASRYTSEMVSALIQRSAPAVDAESGWQRLMILSGGRAARVKPRSTRWSTATALALVTGALVLATLRSASHISDPKANVFALVRDAQAHPAHARLRDACCADHDGGDVADDGLLTLSKPGEKVTVVIVYEDVDRSGTFTHGDVVRYVSTIPNATQRESTSP